MATISFAKKPSAPEPTTAVAVVPKTETAVAPPSLFKIPQLEGEFTARDQAVPYLSLGQKSGTLCDGHPDWLGRWVWDKAACLGDTIKVVICRLRKYYESDLEFNSDEIGNRYDTAAEGKDDPAGLRDVCDIDVLVEVEDEELSEFEVFSHEGKSYIPARYTVRKSSYGTSVKFILKDLAGWLKGDLSGGFYQFSTEKRSGKGNTWWVPKLKADGKVPDALRAKIAERFSS